MNIAGVLVHAHPARLAGVRCALSTTEGVEVHRVTKDGRLVVTVEDVPGAQAAETVLALHRMEGVLSAALVYHHFEPDEEPSESQERDNAAVTA